MMHNIFSIGASGVNAQLQRLNTIAGNLANADNSDGDPAKVFKARQVVFQSKMMDRLNGGLDGGLGVRVREVVESKKPLKLAYEPHNPKANADGNVFYPNVNSIEEMANMIATSRLYESNITVLNTAKELAMKTLQLGK